MASNIYGTLIDCKMSQALKPGATWQNVYKWSAPSTFTSGSEVYCSRTGQSDGNKYYCTALKFSINEKFTNGTELTLKLYYPNWRSTVYKADNTSAILCKAANNLDNFGFIASKTIHSIEDSSSLLALPEYIAVSESGKDTGENGLEKIWTFNFNSPNILQPNTEYFIYLKRKIGLANNSSNGFLPLLTPTVNKNYEIILLGDPLSEDIVKPENYKLSPEEIDSMQLVNNSQKFEILGKNTEIEVVPDSFGEINWSYKAFDEDEKEIFLNEGDIELDQDGNDQTKCTFKYNRTTSFFGKIKIIASWGNNSYQLESIINFYSKWPGLKSWLIGYVYQMASFLNPPISPVAFGFGNIILPASFSIPRYINTQNVNSCLVKSLNYSDTYFLYMIPATLIYDNITGKVKIRDSNKETITYTINTIEKSKENRWSEYEIKTENVKDFSIMPIWSSRDIKDEFGVIKIKGQPLEPIFIGDNRLKED